MFRNRYVVINADDFGLSDAINEGILSAHEKGCLTSASLMANGPVFEKAVEIAMGSPDLGVGVHVNFIRGKPISKLKSVDRLVDERGLFPGTVSSVMRRLTRDPIALDQAESECSAQVERLIKAGIVPTHMDSEKHLHMYPPLFRRLINVARCHGIKWIRIVEENGRLWSLNATAKQMGKALLLRYFARKCRRKANEAGLLCADFFYGVLHAGHMGKDVYQEIIGKTGPGVTEIVSHPGFDDNGRISPDFGPYFISEKRQYELDALLDGSLTHELRIQQITLTNFEKLP
jgi:predicted glycoside hydrolase/deacetylase ChbG (UPF0249 family)